MILLIDNFDSFTYILFQYLSELEEVRVIKNNEPLPESLSLFSSVVISPGPGKPVTSGLLMKHISNLIGRLPMLGVCLGHQALAEFFGARLEKAPEIFHGRTSEIYHSKTDIYKSIPSPFLGNRYHSWVVSSLDFPSELEVTAQTNQNVIMGIRVKSCPNVFGVQFHPESILTEHGKTLIKNFYELTQ